MGHTTVVPGLVVYFLLLPLLSGILPIDVEFTKTVIDNVMYKAYAYKDNLYAEYVGSDTVRTE